MNRAAQANDAAALTARRARFRARLEMAIEMAIDLLDQMEAEDADREDDELGDEAHCA